MSETLRQQQIDRATTEDHGPAGTPEERARMERLEGELSAHERKTREHADAENVARAEPAKGWMNPRSEDDLA